MDCSWPVCVANAHDAPLTRRTPTNLVRKKWASSDRLSLLPGNNPKLYQKNKSRLDHMSAWTGDRSHSMQVARVAPDRPVPCRMHRRRVLGDHIRYVGLDVHKDGIVVAVAESGLRGEVREWSYRQHADGVAAAGRQARPGGDTVAVLL